MKGIHLGRYEGKTTQAIAEVRRLGAIGGNRVLLVTVSRKEGDKIFQAQKAKGEPILRPISIEFWQGRPNRLHDRFRYSRVTEAAGWTIERLAP